MSDWNVTGGETSIVARSLDGCIVSDPTRVNANVVEQTGEQSLDNGAT